MGKEVFMKPKEITTNKRIDFRVLKKSIIIIIVGLVIISIKIIGWSIQPNSYVKDSIKYYGETYEDVEIIEMFQKDSEILVHTRSIPRSFWALYNEETDEITYHINYRYFIQEEESLSIAGEFAVAGWNELSLFSYKILNTVQFAGIVVVIIGVLLFFFGGGLYKDHYNVQNADERVSDNIETLKASMNSTNARTINRPKKF